MESPNSRTLKAIFNLTDQQMALMVKAHFNELSATTDLMNFGAWLETVLTSFNENSNKRQRGKKDNHQPRKGASEYDLDDFTRTGRCRRCFKPGHGVSGCDKPVHYRPEKTCDYCWDHHRSIANTHSTSECNKKKKGVPVRRQKKTSFNNPLDDSDEYSD